MDVVDSVILVVSGIVPVGLQIIPPQQLVHTHPHLVPLAIGVFWS